MILLAAALAISASQPGVACSGYSPRSHQYAADVVVAGKVVATPDGKSETIVARRVLKGERLRAYPVTWIVASYDDECAFLYPTRRKRGVYFLRRRDEGGYYVTWTEDRWKMVRR